MFVYVIFCIIQSYCCRKKKQLFGKEGLVAEFSSNPPFFFKILISPFLVTIFFNFAAPLNTIYPYEGVPPYPRSQMYLFVFCPIVRTRLSTSFIDSAYIKLYTQDGHCFDFQNPDGDFSKDILQKIFEISFELFFKCFLNWFFFRSFCNQIFVKIGGDSAQKYL